MIDFIKIWIDLNGKQYTNPSIEFTGEYNTTTGEIKPSYYAKYKNINIKTLFKHKNGIYTPNLLEIKGSLHYLSNNGEHNYNFFEYSNLINSIFELLQLLQIEPERMKIKNLEYGVNLNLETDTTQILNNLLLHQNKPFTDATDKDGFKYKQCAHAHYIVKAYNKGAQFKLPTNVLRFEIKYLKSYLFNQYGIYTILDILDIDKLRLLHDDLIKKWSECIMYEPPINKPNELNKWSNILHWGKLKKDKDRNLFSDNRKIFDNYIVNETANLNSGILKNIVSQWCKFTTFDKELINSQMVQIYTLNIVSNCTTNCNVKCLITGKDISDQKKGSKFLSENKIGYKKAHDLRNEHSNPRNNIKRSIEKIFNQNSLFDNSEFIVLNEKQKEILKFWEGTDYDILRRYNLT